MESAAHSATSPASAVRNARRWSSCATEGAEEKTRLTIQVQVNPLTEDGTEKEVGLAVPAKTAAPEDACNGRMAKTGSGAPCIATAMEACKKNLDKGASAREV